MQFCFSCFAFCFLALVSVRGDLRTGRVFGGIKSSFMLKFSNSFGSPGSTLVSALRVVESESVVVGWNLDPNKTADDLFKKHSLAVEYTLYNCGSGMEVGIFGLPSNTKRK